MKLKNIFLLAILAVFILAGCNNQTEEKKTKSKPEISKEVKNQAKTTAATNNKEKVVPAKKLGQKVLISTEFGDMTVLLYDETPKHRDNFIKLAKAGFYNGTLFHRVIKGFMIQGGDPESKNAVPGQHLGSGGPGYTIEAEILPEFIHKKGALSAARLGDQANPEKRSSGSQFYIVQGNKVSASELNQMAQRTGAFYTADQIETYQEIGGTPFLDNNYTVFGEVIKGIEVIDIIADSKTQPGDRPVEDIKMTVKLINE